MGSIKEYKREIPLLAFLLAAAAFYVVVVQANAFTSARYIIKVFDIKNPSAINWIYAWMYIPPIYSIYMYIANYGFEETNKVYWIQEIIYMANMFGVSGVLFVLGSEYGGYIIGVVGVIILIIGIAEGGPGGAFGGLLAMGGIALAASFTPYICVFFMVGHILFLMPTFLKGWNFSFIAHQAEVVADGLHSSVLEPEKHRAKADDVVKAASNPSNFGVFPDVDGRKIDEAAKTVRGNLSPGEGGTRDRR